MNTFTQLLNHWSPRRHEAAVLATVVRTTGSTYRKAGARMLISADGATAGMVSGGCLERDIAERARTVLRSGCAALIPYNTRRLFGCSGSLEILIESLPPEAGGKLFEALEYCLEKRRALVATTVFAVEKNAATPLGSWPMMMENGDRSGGDFNAHEGFPFLQQADGDARLALQSAHPLEKSYQLNEGTAAALLQGIQPPLQLLIFGAGPDVTPVASLAVQLGWSTAVVIHPSAEAPDVPWRCRVLTLSPDMDELPFKPDARTAAVVMTHHYGRDLAWMARLMPMPLQYLGLLGPKARREQLLGTLLEAGILPADETLERLHAPAGLDLGADGPEEIALSIISEIKAVSAGRCGGFLRDRAGSIHGENRGVETAKFSEPAGR